MRREGRSWKGKRRGRQGKEGQLVGGLEVDRGILAKLSGFIAIRRKYFQNSISTWKKLGSGLSKERKEIT